jgi:hypothetical protein
MDTKTLVSDAHQLADLLQEAGIPPIMMMWFRASDADIWRLWIVPHESLKREAEFYRRMTQIISSNRAKLANLHASDIDLIDKDHPALDAIRGMASFIGFGRGKCSLTLSHNVFNGLFIPDGILVFF